MWEHGKLCHHLSNLARATRARDRVSLLERAEARLEAFSHAHMHQSDPTVLWSQKVSNNTKYFEVSTPLETASWIQSSMRLASFSQMSCPTNTSSLLKILGCRSSAAPPREPALPSPPHSGPAQWTDDLSWRCMGGCICDHLSYHCCSHHMAALHAYCQGPRLTKQI